MNSSVDRKRKRFSAMPPVSIRNGIWSLDSKPQNSSHRGGPDQGKEGLGKLEELVATTREAIGDKVDLMLDAWTGFDIEHTVRVCETMKPYGSEVDGGLHPCR